MDETGEVGQTLLPFAQAKACGNVAGINGNGSRVAGRVLVASV